MNRFAPALPILLLAVSGCAVGLLGSRIGGIPDPREDLGRSAAEILSRSIQIKTVNPPGDERPVAELLVDLLERFGAESRLVETPRGSSQAGRAAAWGRVRGAGRKRPVVLLSHLDVVPAEASEWALDPFSGVTGGGYVVGRGALDAKGIAVVHLLALARIAQRDQPLDRDVILLATPDEETGGVEGAGFVARRRPELLGGAEFLLTEGGGILLGEPGQPDVWGVSVSEKSPCWLRLRAHGLPGHSSTAPRESAVDRLVEALHRAQQLEMPIRVVPEVARMFAALAPLASESDRASLRDLERALATDPSFRRRFLADRSNYALVRNTLAITVIRTGTQTNVIPSEAVAHVDARLLPGERCEDFTQELVRAIDDPELDVETLLAFESSASPSDTPLFEAIRAVASEVDPDARVVARVNAGFTDAHWFRELGIVSYGFVPRWLPPNETRGIHGANERISVENLERGVETLVRILEEL